MRRSKRSGRYRAFTNFPALVDQMVGILKDKKRQYRWAAAIVLGELGSRAAEAESALKEASTDPDGEVRRYAQDALKKIKGGN